MNETKNQLISEELALAGEASGLSPTLLDLEKNRITSTKELPPIEFLFSLFDEPCFPRKELVAFTGRAKSGKTFVMSMLMVLCAVEEVLAFKRHTESGGHTDHTDYTDKAVVQTTPPDGTPPRSSSARLLPKGRKNSGGERKPLRVLWYDTEQSDNSTQDILRNRIIPLFHRAAGADKAFPEDMFDIFNVRNVDRDKREDYLFAAIAYYKPDLVILDGIRDLVGDINDGTVAQELIEKLMKSAQQNNCCIVCVLHQNKSGDSRDPRGWLGTELLNKAFDVFATEKLMPQRIFKLEQLYTRKYDIEQMLWFEVDDEGLPVVCEEPPVTAFSTDSENDSRPMLNDKYVIHHPDGRWEMDIVKLFTDAMTGYDILTGEALRYRIKLLGNIATNNLYRNCLDKAMKAGLLDKSKDKKRRVIYSLRHTGTVPAESSAANCRGTVPCVSQPSLFSDDGTSPT